MGRGRKIRARGPGEKRRSDLEAREISRMPRPPATAEGTSYIASPIRILHSAIHHAILARIWAIAGDDTLIVLAMAQEYRSTSYACSPYYRAAPSSFPPRKLSKIAID